MAHFPHIQSADMVRLLTALDLAMPCGMDIRPSDLGAGTTISTAPPHDADLLMPCLDRSEGPSDEASLYKQTTFVVESTSESADEKVFCYMLYHFCIRDFVEAHCVYVLVNRCWWSTRVVLDRQTYTMLYDGRQFKTVCFRLNVAGSTKRRPKPRN